MATIVFSNGQRVQFDGTPTQADVEQVATKLGLHQPQQPATTPPQTGSAGQPVLPNSTLGQNLKALPKQLLGAGKALLHTITGNEQSFGADIAAPLTAPGQIKEAAQTAADQNAYIRVLAAKRTAAQAAGQDTSHYDALLDANRPALGKTPDLPSTGKVLSDAAGVALDAATAGTYSKAGLVGDKALTTGLERAAPTAITAGKAAINAAKSAVTTTPEQAALKETAKIIDAVSPKLTAKETAQAIADRGGTKTGILKTIKANVDPAVERIAKTVQDYVPEFNPKASLVENINATRAATDQVAHDLKQSVIQSGQDRIYSFKELNKTLQSLPKPTLLVGDLEKVYSRVVDKAMEIARSNGGKVSDLFQARKEFDDFIRQEFPNLYSSDTLTPMRSAIKAVRNAMTDFTAEHLPEDVALHDQLTVQSRLLDAIQNMSEKAASGPQKEIGTNVLKRAEGALKNHPVAGAFGGIAAYEAAKKLPVIGDVLP